MEQERRFVDDQVLIEAELEVAGQRQRRIDAVDAGGDLVDVRAGLLVRDHVRALVLVYGRLLGSPAANSKPRYEVGVQRAAASHSTCRCRSE
jgi:hypothetical protein